MAGNPLGGKNGTFAFAGQTLQVEEAIEAAFEDSSSPIDITPGGWVGPRHYFPRKVRRGTVTLCQTSSAKAPLPTMAVGTATFTLVSGTTYAGKAALHRLGTAWRSAPDGPTFARYDWIEQAESSSDTWT